MLRWTMLSLVFAVAIVGFADVSNAWDFGTGEKMITTRHGGSGGGHRGGGIRHGGGGHRGGRR